MNKTFNVLLWDFNSDSMKIYDVIPYFTGLYKDLKPKQRPSSVEEFKEFVTGEGKHMFWSRCQYEIVVTGFPKRQNDEKIDVWNQIEMNLDIVVDILMESLEVDKHEILLSTNN